MDPSDNEAIYTDAFVARQTARILGVFSAITRPTTLSSLLLRFPFHPRLFRSELDRLLSAGCLPGRLQGRGDKTEYVPSIQQKTQDRWIETFYRNNQYASTSLPQHHCLHIILDGDVHTPSKLTHSSSPTTQVRRVRHCGATRDPQAKGPSGGHVP
jgi:hypothetical protein